MGTLRPTASAECSSQHKEDLGNKLCGGSIISKLSAQTRVGGSCLPEDAVMLLTLYSEIVIDSQEVAQIVQAVPCGSPGCHLVNRGPTSDPGSSRDTGVAR